MSILIRFCLRKGSKVMRKLLKRFLEKLVAWGQRKKESERIWRDIEKMVEENKVKR